MLSKVIEEKILSFDEASRCLSTLGKDESGSRYAYLMMTATDRYIWQVSVSGFQNCETETQTLVLNATISNFLFWQKYLSNNKAVQQIFIHLQVNQSSLTASFIMSKIHQICKPQCERD